MNKIIILFCLLTTISVFSQGNIPNVDLKTMEGKTISFHEVTDQTILLLFPYGQHGVCLASKN